MHSLTILCSGQGFQSVNMFRRLETASAWRREYTYSARLPRKFAAWLMAPNEKGFDDGEIAQPALTVYCEMAWRLIEERLPSISLVLGYSLGELAAIGITRMMQWPDVHQLAAIRGAAMQHACAIPSMLVSIRGCNRQRVLEICHRSGAKIAITNGPTHFVVGLLRPQLAELKQETLEAGGNLTELKVAVAAHTPWLKTATAEFRQALSTIDIRSAVVPAVSSIDASLVRTPSQAVDALSGQIAQPLDWSRSLRETLERGNRVFLEIGPGRALCRMLLEHNRNVHARSIDEFSSVGKAVEWVCSSCAQGA
jgi:[acyl-carrier-protein] S-malonyltransferase